MKELMSILMSSYRSIDLVYEPARILRMLSSKEKEYKELSYVHKHARSLAKNIPKLVRSIRIENRDIDYHGINLKVYLDLTKTSDLIFLTLIHKFVDCTSGIKVHNISLPYDLDKLIYRLYEEEPYTIAVIPANRYMASVTQLSIEEHLIPIALFVHDNEYWFPLIKGAKIPVVMLHPDYSFPAYNFLDKRYPILKHIHGLELSIYDNIIVEKDPRNKVASLFRDIGNRIDRGEIFYTADKTHVNVLVRKILETQILNKKPKYVCFKRQYYDVIVVSKQLMEHYPQLVLEIVAFIVAKICFEKVWESDEFQIEVFRKQAKHILNSCPQIGQIIAKLLAEG